jgi:GMP synthase-like glutamine amidotransferase
MASLRFLVLEHEREVPAALFGEWATDRGHATHTVSVPQLDGWPAPRDYDAIVSLGSDRSVATSPEPWIAHEVGFLRRAHREGVPVLGICFGAQALATALGGEVSRAPRIALEWTTLATHDPDLVSPGPWFRWHEDRLTVPAGARKLASAGDVPLAFIAGSSVGLQFHPEVGAELASAWIEESQRKLIDHEIDQRRLGREAALALPGAPARARELFDRIAALWQARAGTSAASIRS